MFWLLHRSASHAIERLLHGRDLPNVGLPTADLRLEPKRQTEAHSAAMIEN
jgi:hypothetical protein